MQRLTLIVFVTLGAIPVAAGPDAGPAPRHELFFAYNTASWKESLADGTPMLEEEGYLLGLHVRSHWRAEQTPDIRTEARGFAGTLDYDGMTFAGEPLRTTTEYRGLGAATDLGLQRDLGRKAGLRLFGGLSADGWIRGIDHTGRLSGQGYNEFWFTLEAVAGVAVAVEAPGDYRWFLEPGLAYPVYQRVAYDLTFPDGTDDVSVEPGREPGFSIEAGLRTPRWMASLLYRTRTFGQSDSVSAPPFSVYQPESEQETLALRFGIRF